MKNMPHVIISSQVRLDVGPTFVGDEWSDPELMESLNASLIKQLGNNYAQYKTELAPRQVLDRLETKGFRLLAMTGVGQTCIWTLHKEPSTVSACSNDDFDSSKCMDISSTNEMNSPSNTELKSNASQ
ncbi:GTP cyclohydrolase 1 feedback regulatory protein [Elysia marginata]|uniref:GTP cyclohydrolase 1 feedback regulatory protein n=1 Tax=Elysia marginata TaxID=1093978 RepID=A0AAV4JIB6_9GAST|nr:GTP cyclohydrolase 1 feedback regulatory protein [Elysia marginata]